MALVDLLFTLQEPQQVKLNEVAERLKSQGVEVQRTYPRSGTIAGRGDSSMLNELRSVEGIATVRPQGGYQLPPMDEKVPQ